MKRELKLILIIAAIILISAAFLGPKQGALNEADSGKTGFVTKILTDMDFTGDKTVAKSIIKSSEIKININPFGE